jgi:hypothetical protein
MPIGRDECGPYRLADAINPVPTGQPASPEAIQAPAEMQV